jgi:adenylate cyclase
VYKEVEKKLPLGTVVSLGKPKLKNIAERFPVYALLPEAPTGVWQKLQVQRLKLSRRLRPIVFVSVSVVVLVVVSMLLLGGLGTFLFPSLSPFRILRSEIRNQAVLPLPDKPSIVVLPFTNLSNNPEQEYFSDGITEDLTSSLSRLTSLFVISRNTAFFYKGKAVKLSDLSKELGVQYVLEGSVRRADGQVRVTAQLIDATQDRHLWSERYDRPLQDIFALQDEIVQKIVTTLKLQLSLWEQGILVRKTTDSLEAYDEYLRGRALLFHLKKEVTVEARRMFERAVELDPHYAEAYTALGFTYLAEWSYQWSQAPQTLEQAFEFTQKAVVLDNSLPGAHLTLSWVYQWKKQYEQAIAEGERTIALDPNGADGYAILAEVLSYGLRPEEAIKLIEKAMRLSPQYPAWYLITLGRAYLFAGRTEEAVATLKRAIVRNRDLLPPHVLLVFLYSELGRDEEARAEAAEVLRVSPNFSLEGLQQRAPYKDPAVLERYLAALRKAGLK